MRIFLTKYLFSLDLTSKFQVKAKESSNLTQRSNPSKSAIPRWS